MNELQVLSLAPFVLSSDERQACTGHHRNHNRKLLR